MSKGFSSFDMNNFYNTDFETEQTNDNSSNWRNKRVLPTGKELKDKKFYIGLWTYIQYVSKCNHSDDYRYVNKKDLLPNKVAKVLSNLSKENKTGEFVQKKVSAPSIRKGIQYLIDNGYIVGEVDGSEVFEGYDGLYYKIKNKDVFDYYVLLDNDFIEKLLKTLTQDELKAYLFYYGWNRNKNIGTCKLKRGEVLSRIGFSNARANRDKLRHIDSKLREYGLIQQKKECVKDSLTGEYVASVIVTSIPFYWDSELFVQEVDSDFDTSRFVVEYEDLE